MTVRRVRVAELVCDENFHPRCVINNQNVSRLVHAIEGGAKLPPIVAWDKNNLVADGFHRVRAVLQVFGEGGEIDCDFRKYANKAQFFAECMRLNADHGVVLTKVDWVRCYELAKKYRLPQKAVAEILHTTEKKLKELIAARVAWVKDNGTERPVGLKRTVLKFAGKRLSKEQEIANDKLSGLSQQFYVGQILILIRSNMLDKENESLMAKLTELRDELNSIITE